MENQMPQAFIFMRVGNHAGESFDSILERKRREFEDSGQIFWGYGGTTLHPIRHVQPFAKLRVQEGGSINIVMEYINSKADPDVIPASEFSVDGIKWEPIPPGIRVTGSRYAIVLDEIKPGDLDLDLAKYQVGIGPSRGRNAAGYVRGRVDKGCFIAADSADGNPDTQERLVKVQFQARLLEPYAVMLRSHKDG